MQLDYWVKTLIEHEMGMDMAHAMKIKSMYKTNFNQKT